jgi:hypothetical protein
MAATVRAVFQIALQRTSVRSKPVALKRNAKQRCHRSARPGRSSGKASRLHARYAAPATEDHNGMTGLGTDGRRGEDLRIPTSPPDEPDAGASAGDRARGRRSSDRTAHGKDTGRQVLPSGRPRAGESGVDLRVGPICICDLVRLRSPCGHSLEFARRGAEGLAPGASVGAPAQRKITIATPEPVPAREGFSTPVPDAQISAPLRLCERPFLHLLVTRRTRSCRAKSRQAATASQLRSMRTEVGDRVKWRRTTHLPHSRPCLERLGRLPCHVPGVVGKAFSPRPAGIVVKVP